MAVESTGYGKISDKELGDRDYEVWSKAQRDRLIEGEKRRKKINESPLGSQLPQQSEEGRPERIAGRVPQGEQSQRFGSKSEGGIMNLEEVYAFADSMKRGKQEAAKYDVSELEKIVEIINRKNIAFNEKVQMAIESGGGEAAAEKLAPIYEVREGQIFVVDQEPVGPQPPQMAGPAQAPAAAPQALGGMGPMSNIETAFQDRQIGTAREQIARSVGAPDDGYGTALNKSLGNRLKQK